MNQEVNATEEKPVIPAAMVEPIGGHAGAHYYDFGLCRGLMAAGCRVSLYTCDETADPAIPGLSFYPCYRGIYGRGSRLMRMQRYVRGTLDALSKASKSGEIIFHFQVFNDIIPELIVITLAKLFGRKIVLTVHDVSSLAGPVSWKRRLTGWVYRRADRIIVHNKVSMQELVSIGLPSQKIFVIPHGNYLDSMRQMPSSAEARRALGIAEDAKVVLFFGQIKEVKGLDLLIEALPAVARDVPGVLLLIAGRPWKTEFARYDALIDTLRIRERCNLNIGFISDADVATYYAAADVVALPYRRIYQSGVLLMAMTYGRAVVVSDLPGMTEMVTDGTNGYVFALNSKGTLAEALVRALKSDRERVEIGTRALQYVRVEHDWKRIGAATAQLYRSLISP